MWPFGPFFRRHGDTVDLKTHRRFLSARQRLEPGGFSEACGRNRANFIRGPMGLESPETGGAVNFTADADCKGVPPIYFPLWLQVAFYVHAPDVAESFRSLPSPCLKNNFTTKPDPAFPDENRPRLLSQGGFFIDARCIAKARFVAPYQALPTDCRPENYSEKPGCACVELGFLSVRGQGLSAVKSFEITLKVPRRKLRQRTEKFFDRIREKYWFGGFYLEIVNDIIKMYISLMSCAKKGKWGLTWLEPKSWGPARCPNGLTGADRLMTA